LYCLTKTNSIKSNMSFTLPSIFKSSPQPAPQPGPSHFELPPFERRQEIHVLPYDLAAGETVKRALLYSGRTILKNEFGIQDPETARQKTTLLAEKATEVGSDTLHALESLKEEAGDDRLERMWQDRALQGDEAMLALLSLKELAISPDQGFYADRAADLLNEVQAGDTRIALK
jgi:hypothetical protein